MISPHRQLQVAADTIAGTLPHLWRPEWEHVTRPDLPGLLADVYEPYGRLADAVAGWWATPGREGWDIPADHPNEISAAAGWDITDSLGHLDPLLPWTVCRHWIDQLAARIYWWRLRSHGEAIVHELEHGRPPGRADLVRLLDAVRAGQAEGTIEKPGGDRKSDQCPNPDNGQPLTLGELGIDRRRFDEARGAA